MVESSNINKYLYKAILVVLKFTPATLALCSMLNTILWCFDIDIPAFSFVGGLSIIPWIFIYLASIVFKFCSYHRMFLYYIAIDNILSTIDYYCNIGFGLVPYLLLIITTIFVVTYLHIKEKKNESTIKKTS